MSVASPLFIPLGDSAITVVLGEGTSRELSRQVLSVAEAVRNAAIAEVTEVIPAYASFAVFYNPLEISYEGIVERLRPSVSGDTEKTTATAPRTIRIPVRYNGEDLEEVARRTSHTVDEVIALHSGRTYYVYVIGFVPGWAYLGEIDPSLVLPRRAAPRKRVPQGSVAIAEAQTGIYPFATPGGWHLLGTTETRMFDPNRAEPSLLRVGDSVVFEPV